MKGNLIEVSKSYRSYNKGEISKFLNVNNQDKTRNNGLKLEKFRFKREIRRNWFSNRMVDEWNGLNNNFVSAETIGIFFLN